MLNVQCKLQLKLNLTIIQEIIAKLIFYLLPAAFSLSLSTMIKYLTLTSCEVKNLFESALVT